MKQISYLDDSINLLALSDEDAARFKNPDNDPRGPWTSTDFTAQGFRPNQMYTIKTPGGAEYTPADGHCWKNVEEVYLKQLAEGRMWFGADGKGVPRRKTYLSEREGKNVWTWWPNTEVGHTQEATQELISVFGLKTVFDYPKPTRLLKRIIQLATSPSSIILDSFAGSGTTAHAVLNLNKQDGGNRKFILVEMEDYADSITAERVRRVINGYGEGKNAVAGTGGDFNYYELGPEMLLDDNLNEEQPVENIRKYIYYTETNSVVDEEAVKKNGNEFFLGNLENTAYYMFYKKNEVTTLDAEFLGTISQPAERFVIYADNCVLPKDFLFKHNIVFKKIPRDVRKF